MTTRSLPRSAAICVLAIASTMLAAARPVAAAEPPPDPWASVGSGTAVLLRHATAPGIGDPRGFTLGACTTQRNLDATGRAEAQRIGAAFRAHGIAVAKVLSSQWCRTRETADLAFPGLAREEPVFNSFFDDADSDPVRTAAARALLLAWRGPGVLVVVTHQVNITALTGIVPGAGEGVVVVPAGDTLRIVGRIAPAR